MLCAGAGVWILVFWLYEPRDPTVTYGGTPYRGGGSTLAQIDTISAGPGDSADGFGGDSLDPTVPLPEAERAGPVGGASPGSGVSPGAAPTTFAPRVVAPEFWEYTVQRGDSSWESIAEKTLGDRRLASAVLRANPLVSPDKLIPGRTRLKIPRDPKNIQGKVVQVPVSPPTPSGAAGDSADGAKPASEAGAASAETPGAKSHTVARGETLSQIAQTHLGSAAKWREIYEANRGVIADPDRLKPGTVLRIPAQKPRQ